MGKRNNPLRKLSGVVQRSQAQLEGRMMYVLRLVFWAALLAPVVILPAYYLLVAFGLAPPLHLPG